LSKRSRHIVWVVANASRILAGIVGLSIIAILFTSRPTTHLTIEAGTKGGLFDVMAQDLKESLAPQGIDVEVVNRPDSLRIIDDIVERWLTKETSDLQNMEESLRSARSHV
jgi:hypothetical protein